MTSRPKGPLLGIDFGTVRLGLAICDRNGRLSSPLDILQRQPQEVEARYFRKLVKQEEVKGIVVGLPVHLDGRESQKSQEARAYGKWLEETTGLPIYYFDERFTSVQAEQILMDAQLTKKKRQARLDKLAASLMLQAYLDSQQDEQASIQPLDD
ncbi:Holliday junction resolvase RuvX [Planctomycetales bacterium 10988]|nr:Holliday junction resolvase RuvX [Planctomycetales bacterium 10988]